jgi:hypothetical protein
MQIGSEEQNWLFNIILYQLIQIDMLYIEYDVVFKILKICL